MALPSNWKNWVLQMLLKGHPAIQILNTLLENGFLFEDGKAALGGNLPANVNSPLNRDFFTRLSQPDFLQHLARVEDHSTDKIQLYTCPDFLSRDECEQIIAVAQADFEPSKISAKKGYQQHRTSSTCNLTFLNAPIVGEVEEKIITLLKLGVGENEVMQAQRYQVGQEFKAHTDYFEPGTEEYRTYASKRGQRTWTCMIYLNDACEGGQTEFVNIGKAFSPKTGCALFWNNLLPNGMPNPDTLHHAHPVTQGEKYVITKWFRTLNQ